jgi:hypothetical protein
MPLASAGGRACKLLLAASMFVREASRQQPQQQQRLLLLQLCDVRCDSSWQQHWCICIPGCCLNCLSAASADVLTALPVTMLLGCWNLRVCAVLCGKAAVLQQRSVSCMCCCTPAR